MVGYLLTNAAVRWWTGARLRRVSRFTPRRSELWSESAWTSCVLLCPSSSRMCSFRLGTCQRSSAVSELL